VRHLCRQNINSIIFVIFFFFKALINLQGRGNFIERIGFHLLGLFINFSGEHKDKLLDLFDPVKERDYLILVRVLLVLKIVDDRLYLILAEL
jgi:hypothetical protein